MIPKDAVNYVVTRDGIELRVIRKKETLRITTPDLDCPDILAEVVLSEVTNDEDRLYNIIVYAGTCAEIGINPERVYNIALNRNDWHAKDPYNYYRKIIH